MNLNVKKINNTSWCLQVEDTKKLFVDIGSIQFRGNKWFATPYGHSTKIVRNRYEAITHIMLKRGLIY